jgi:hypothetical protein
LTTPVTVVDKVIAGVVVAVATVPAKPLADTTDALVTVPEPPPPPVALIVWFGQVPDTVTFVPATILGVLVPVPPYATAIAAPFHVPPVITFASLMITPEF